MIHVDVKLGKIPAGGGWRLHGRDAAVSVANRHQKTKIGYDYARTAIDDHTRPANSEIHDDEKDPACAAFLRRPLAWFAAQGVHVRRVLTDNAMVYRHGTDWGWVCSAWQLKRRFRGQVGAATVGTHLKRPSQMRVRSAARSTATRQPA
jgi:hypothetical protein